MVNIHSQSEIGLGGLEAAPRLELFIAGGGKPKLSISVGATFIGCSNLVVCALISFESQLNGAQDG